MFPLSWCNGRDGKTKKIVFFFILSRIPIDKIPFLWYSYKAVNIKSAKRVRRANEEGTFPTAAGGGRREQKGVTAFEVSENE